MVRSLVIGANGFIGSHLVDELAAQGHEVTAFDRFSSGIVTFDRHDAVRVVAGDFLNRADVRRAVEGHDAVYHFLSTTTPATAEDDPTLDVRTNISASIDLFQAAVDAGVSDIHFASTGGAIYGKRPELLLSEDTLPVPVSPYAIGKLAIEGYLRYFADKYGVRTTSFRISNPYGPRQSPVKRQGVIPIFLHRILDGKPLTVLGDGGMVRDYLYVQDVARMVVKAVAAGPQRSVYNIGSGRGTTLNELIEAMRLITGIDPEIDHREVPSTYVSRAVLDVTRYEQEFGTTTCVPLTEGIERTWRAVKAQS